MSFSIQPKTKRRIYIVIGCFAAWITYTMIFRQIVKFDNTKMPTTNLDLKEEIYEVDQRVSVCFKDVIPFNMLLKEDAETCQNSLQLLIMIHVEPSEFKLRNLFRNEFARMKMMAASYGLRIGAVFILGLDKTLCVSAELLAEIKIHKDILVGGFIDTYYNQTVKSITMLKWFINDCSNTNMLLKLSSMTDPKSLNIREFYKLIQRLLHKEEVLLGSTIILPLAEKQDKAPWIAAPYLYPGLPQHLHLNYLLSRNVVTSLLKAQANAIYISIWKEDVYVTGVLANIAGVRRQHDPRFLTECNGNICAFCSCPGRSFNFLQKESNNMTDDYTNTTYESLVMQLTNTPSQETEETSQYWSESTTGNTFRTEDTTETTEKWSKISETMDWNTYSNVYIETAITSRETNVHQPYKWSRITNKSFLESEKTFYSLGENSTIPMSTKSENDSFTESTNQSLVLISLAAVNSEKEILYQYVREYETEAPNLSAEKKFTITDEGVTTLMFMESNMSSTITSIEPFTTEIEENRKNINEHTIKFNNSTSKKKYSTVFELMNFNNFSDFSTESAPELITFLTIPSQRLESTTSDILTTQWTVKDFEQWLTTPMSVDLNNDSDQLTKTTLESQTSSTTLLNQNIQDTTASGVLPQQWTTEPSQQWSTITEHSNQWSMTTEPSNQWSTTTEDALDSNLESQTSSTIILNQNIQETTASGGLSEQWTTELPQQWSTTTEDALYSNLESQTSSTSEPDHNIQEITTSESLLEQWTIEPSQQWSTTTEDALDLNLESQTLSTTVLDQNIQEITASGNLPKQWTTKPFQQWSTTTEDALNSNSYSDQYTETTQRPLMISTTALNHDTTTEDALNLNSYCGECAEITRRFLTILTTALNQETVTSQSNGETFEMESTIQTQT